MYPGRYASITPDKPAAIEAATGREISYRELEDRSVQFAHWLRAHGLGAGDHLAVLSVNDVTVFELYWAAVRSGMYVTFVNTHLAPPEVAYIVDDCDAAALVVSAPLVDLAVAVAGDTPKVRHRLAFGGDVPGHLGYEAEIAAMSTTAPVDQPGGTDMLYSSGTTGRPKGIKPALSGAQVGEQAASNAVGLLQSFGFDDDCVYYAPAPIYHAAPLRFGAAAQALGGTAIVAGRFDAETCLADLERYRVTHSQWVPTHFVRLLKLPEQVRGRYDLSAMRAAIHSAAPCPVEVKQAMIDWWGEVIYEYYSSTESVGSTIVSPQEWLRKPGTVGRTGHGHASLAHICAEDGTELPHGQIGLIYFERPGYSFEYHNDPEKTAESRNPLHPTWATTGDIGYLDEDDYLFLTDRAKFTIISGGVNIYPQEIENALALHPKVFDVAVIGVPDAEMGESVKAVVQPAAGVAGDDALAAELIAYCRDRIAGYKCPRSVDFVDALPRTPTGKLVKGALRPATAGGNG
ncbi:MULTISPECIES: acyl-CoA synthetase [Rhodococcus]|uniref:Acyl-CoA synthetase n=1 Tax=Rhodococcus aetherivorans TaxID=191292 RepID=A0A059MHL4_9NOCA|nr:MULTISPECIES: acyl-CoA synthetase [Rhodococcus]ETT23725.1 o-succinylbenzoate--CoA ligase [Rhodococcus rhodochrous ATCC 21198]ANZ23546.1 acyl-CoA synthetase [Rhodococcus sp. WB1]KDE10665.1 acyl-CoA synthetase [Rhodococcus aetherivorans]MBC2589463.1 acyl-CoA synthetase [Rhodococcus aetherivorans]MDV6296427.1 acyl-CoA synthetase [Rhodococcus aetherivorans]